MTSYPHSEGPLARTGAARVEPWRNQEWQKLWLAMQSRPWRSLAVVPAGAGAPPDFTVVIANTLARTGMSHLNQAFHVADATRLPLAHLVSFAEELKRYTAEGEFVLVALAPASVNPITISLAQQADAALLCVLMEEMSSTDAKKTVNRIGPSRFLGSAVFHPSNIPRDIQTDPPPPAVGRAR
jgi:hypothetical protein